MIVCDERHFDMLNRLTAMEEIGGAGQTTFLFDEGGRLTKKSCANGPVTTYAFDRLDRVTELSNYRSEGGDLLSRFSYFYDAASRRTAIEVTRSVPDGSGGEDIVTENLRYGYDGLSRLTSETRLTESDLKIYEYFWDYDLVGNRTSEVFTQFDGAGLETGTTTTTYSYSAADRLLSEVETDGTNTVTTTYTWDANGNMLSKDVDGELTTYTWDYDDRLIGAELPDGRTVSFEYCDGCSLAKRLKKTILAADGTTILSETTYRWDGENIIGEEDEFGNVVDYFVMPFRLMDNVVSMNRDGQDYYYLTDAMGSVIQVVDGNGNIVNSYDYNSWGEIRAAQTTETVSNPFKWQTKPWDEEMGLYYSRARYYDGGTGRFVGVDPIWMKRCKLLTDRHRFAWPGLNPVTFSDPTGRAIGEKCRRHLDCRGNEYDPGNLTLCRDCCDEQLDKVSWRSLILIFIDLTRDIPIGPREFCYDMCTELNGRGGPEIFDPFVPKEDRLGRPEWMPEDPEEE